MKNAFKSFLLAFTTMIAGTVAFAQVTTSTLSGRVSDPTGEAIPGVVVQAFHEPSGTTYSVVTNGDGRYTIQGMRPGGPYKVEISCLGYQGQAITDITLALAQTFVLDAKLEEDALSLDAVVFVSSPVSKFAAQQRTGAATNVSNREIEAVPSGNRSITDITKLSPYGGNGMDIAGGDGRSVNFTIDGANFNNNFGLNPTLPGGGMPVSMDALEEVQVVVSDFDVRQTNFISGGVNAITKSGTNKTKATAYVYHQNGKLRGTTIEGVELGSLADLQAEKQTVYGATVGFPIIKNKLFFFGSVEYQGDPEVVTPWRPSEDGVANDKQSISRTTIADMERVSNFLKETYGYDTGGYSDYTKDKSTIKLLGRFDYNINDNHHLALRANYTSSKHWVGTNGNSADFNGTKDGSDDELKGTRMSLDRLSKYSMAFRNSLYSMENNVFTISLDLNSKFGSNLSNQLLATYSNIEDVRGSDSEKFPFIDILNGYDASTGVQTLEPYMSAGYELFTWYNGVHNRVFNVKDDITAYLGNHKLTAGVSFEYQFADNAYMREGTGYYRFRSVDDLLNGAAPETVALTYGFLNNGMGDTPSARIRFTQAGLYFQDEWNIDEKFKINAGVRFDRIKYNDADIMRNNKVYDLHFGEGNADGTHSDGDGCRRIDTGKWPTANVQVSPRLGFVYDVFGDQRLKVRGGTGLFAGRLPLVYMTNMPTNAGMFQHLSVLTTSYNTDGTVKDRNAGLDQFAGRFPTTTEEILKKLNEIDPNKNPLEISSEDGSLTTPINAVDPNFKMPQVWKTSIGIDYQVPVSFPFTLTAEFTYNKTINGTVIEDWNLKDNAGWSQWTGSDNRHMYPTNSGYTSSPAYVLSNTNKGYGYIFVLEAKARPIKNLDLRASYTRNVQMEITGMPGNNAGSVFQSLPTVEGTNFATLHTSTYVTPDRLMASASYKFPWGTGVSVYYNGYSSTGFSYLYTNDVNGDAVQQDLIYIPKDKNDILFVDDTQRDIFWDFVEQDPYLSTHKGQYAEAYGAHSKMRHYVDLKISQDIKVKVGNSTNTLQLSCDVMNLTNLLNDSWGVGTTWHSTANSGHVLTLDHINANGQPVFSTPLKAGAQSTQLSHTVGNVWYLQLGLKYMFN